MAGVCHSFPIVVGEFGSNFVLANDLLLFNSFANYLNNVNAVADGLHSSITSWFCWSYNPDSGDTGRIVKNDLITFEWTKLNCFVNCNLINSTSNGLILKLR